MVKTTMKTVLLTFTRPNSPVKIANMRTEETTPPITCHGRKRPKRVLVLSMRFPSRGSRKISAMRMMKNKGCDYADQRFRFGLAVVREQGLGGVVRDEIGAERVVERRLPKVAHSV